MRGPRGRARPTPSPRRCSRLQPLAGRRLWFAGIGGAGLSATRCRARVGRRGGRLGPQGDAVPRARPRGGDRRDGAPEPPPRPRAGRRSSRRPTPTLAGRRAPSCSPSSPRRRIDRRRRRARQDDDRGDDRLRPRPARPRPVLRRSAATSRSSAATRARARAGSSSRATSPTARSPRSGPRSPSSRTWTSTTTRRSPRAPRWSRSSTSGSRTCRTSCAATSSSRPSVELAIPGEHNRRNAAAALAALELAGVARERGRPGARRVRAGPGGGSSRAARRAASRSSTTTRTTRPKSRPRCSRARVAGDGRVLVLFQPHLYSRTLHLARELAAALAAADAVVRHRDLPGARGADRRA